MPGAGGGATSVGSESVLGGTVFCGEGHLLVVGHLAGTDFGVGGGIVAAGIVAVDAGSAQTGRWKNFFANACSVLNSPSFAALFLLLALVGLRIAQKFSRKRSPGCEE